MSRHVARGLLEATLNALKVMGAGLTFFCFYFAFIIWGPAVEGRFSPVITNYELHNVRSVQNGAGFSFQPTFEKTRDCTYYGVTWFAQDENGRLMRVQLGRVNAGPPVTGPTGDRLGDRVTLFPPEGSVAIFGINHHECGLPWQTRTIVGPFEIIDGRPGARITPVRFAFLLGGH